MWPWNRHKMGTHAYKVTSKSTRKFFQVIFMHIRWPSNTLGNLSNCSYGWWYTWWCWRSLNMSMMLIKPFLNFGLVLSIVGFAFLLFVLIVLLLLCSTTVNIKKNDTWKTNKESYKQLEQQKMHYTIPPCQMEAQHLKTHKELVTNVFLEHIMVDGHNSQEHQDWEKSFIDIWLAKMLIQLA